MAIHIRNRRAEDSIRRLAEMRKMGITEAMTLAAENEIRRTSLSDRIRPIQERISKYPKTGLKADKAFFDSLNDE